MQKFKKTLFLIVLFFTLSLTNIGLIGKLHAQNVQKNDYQVLLEEIGHTESDSINQFALSSSPFILENVQSEITLGDARASNLRIFFAKYNSPLYDSADYMVEQADYHGFDYRLLAAIAFQESALCKIIPHGSHNCWGWGIYGDNVIRFTSYDEGIAAVSKGIKENYLDKGLTTASQVMRKYAPSSPGSWSAGVNHFMRRIEE